METVETSSHEERRTETRVANGEGSFIILENLEASKGNSENESKNESNNGFLLVSFNNGVVSSSTSGPRSKKNEGIEKRNFSSRKHFDTSRRSNGTNVNGGSNRRMEEGSEETKEEHDL
jgi:hypothetical protein